MEKGGRGLMADNQPKPEPAKISERFRGRVVPDAPHYYEVTDFEALLHMRFNVEEAEMLCAALEEFLEWVEDMEDGD